VKIGKSIGVLGAGGWGVAIALHWARLGYDVHIWCFESEVYYDMSVNRLAGPFMPGVAILDNIYPTQKLEDVFQNTSLIFECIPMTYLRQVMETSKPYFVEGRHAIISTAKGVESETNKLATKVLCETVSIHNPEVFFCGIGQAYDVVAENFSAGLIVSNDINFAIEIKGLMDTPSFKIEVSSDIVGAQVCASFRYMLTILLGVFKGKMVSHSTTVFFITKALKEISAIVRALNGNIETVFGLAGSLDLIMDPCHDDRTFQLGCSVGQGISLEKINKSFCVVPEGISALISIVDLGNNLGLDLPICQAVKDYVVSGYTIDLINRAKFLTMSEYKEKESSYCN